MNLRRSQNSESLFCFELRRSTDWVQGARVAPVYRVSVLAHTEEAARIGVGAYHDEQLVVLRPGILDRLGSTAGVRAEERADFLQTLGSSLVSGHPLLLALSMGARQARSARMRGVIGELALGVGRGHELHEVMMVHPEVFRPEQVAVAEASGKASLGELGALFAELAKFERRDARTGRRLFAAMAYPALLLLMAVCASLILEMKALPPMAELFLGMGVELPVVTAWFYHGSRFLASQGWWLFPVLGVVAYFGYWAFLRGLRSDAGQRLTCRMPYIGTIVRARSLVRALGVFLLLRESGAGSREVFSQAAKAAGNALVAEYFQVVHKRVARGMSFEESFMAERHRLGDDGTRVAGRMEVGNQGADLGVLIRGLLEELDDQAETRLSVLPRLLELPMLLICGLVIGVILVAMFLPYPSLLADVAKQMR